MKKFFALLLSAIMLLGLLAGCSADKEEEEEEAPYEVALRTLMDAMYKGKAAKAADLAPKAYWEYLDMDENDVEEQLEERWEYMEESFKDEYGKDYKFTYKIKKATKVKSDVLTAIQEGIEEQYGFSPKVKAAYKLEVKATIKGSEDSDESEATYTAIQIDGKWYIVRARESGDDMYVSFLPG